MQKWCKGTRLSAAILTELHKNPFKDIDGLDVQDAALATMQVDEGSDSEDIDMIEAFCLYTYKIMK